MAGKTYFASAESLDEAVRAAHAQIREPSELIASRVVSWGYRTGGIVGVQEFWVEVESVDPDATIERGT